MNYLSMCNYNQCFFFLFLYFMCHSLFRAMEQNRTYELTYFI